MNKVLTSVAVTLLSLSSNTLKAEVFVVDTIGVEKAVAKSPADLLRGKVSGVRVSLIDGNPNGAKNVNVRGINSVRTDSQPLWIVDGVYLNSTVNKNLNAFFPRGEFNTMGSQYPDYTGKSYTSPIGTFNWLDPYEIETIEVVKDLSAVAEYGPDAANGVVIVTTKRRGEGDCNVHWASNVLVDWTGMNSPAFKTGISHNHRIGVSGSRSNYSYYNVSAFINSDDRAVNMTDNLNGGLAVNFETTSNRLFHFGLNAFLNYGKGRSTSGVNYLGAESAMAIVRYPELFQNVDVANWNKDYDDVSKAFHSANSVWLKINILPGFHFKATGGIDYENLSRGFWYGYRTSFGKESNGANAVLSNSLLNYNVKGAFNFVRNFAVKHRLDASIFIEAVGSLEKTNDMCGCDFFSHALRYRSIGASSSINPIQKFNRNNLRWGYGATVGYNYNGYAGIEASVRADINTTYDKAWKIYPNASAFLDFRKMFFKDSKAVSELLVEGGYGTAGKDLALPYEYLTYYIPGVPGIERGLEYYYDGISRLFSREYNVGFRTGFLGGRIRFGVKYFDKNTDDNFKVCNFGKLNNKQYVATKKWEVIQERTSKIRNRGVEADCSFDVFRSGTFTWGINADAAYNFKRECVLDALDDFSGDIVNPADPRTIPTVYGGAGTVLSFFGVTVDAFFSGAAGHELMNYKKEFSKADYIRLDHVSVSYDIPARVKWLQQFRISLSAHNLVTFTDYDGWNPDTNCFGVTARCNGVDYGTFPVCKMVVLGVKAIF